MTINISLAISKQITMCCKLEEMEWLRDCLTDTALSFDTFFSLICETLDLSEYERSRVLRSVPDDFMRQVGHFEILCAVLPDGKRLRLSYCNLSLPIWSDITISFFMLRRINEVLTKLQLFDHFEEFFIWWVRASIALLRNDDLDEVKDRRACRKGPQDGVMFSVWLGKHYQVDEILILEYQPFEQKPGLPHVAG